ncbi:hypothetical protein ZOSMA_389G00030 [Zostera marina]|uniref:Uncharacterized protein n=1 Tax=Zostera marina TaxID=29655 RepID=A0A0K9P763_ZOSMR|nr:hypothetical protein ZOSMA_389G00030 [Zostera marina]
MHIPDFLSYGALTSRSPVQQTPPQQMIEPEEQTRGQSVNIFSKNIELSNSKLIFKNACSKKKKKDNQQNKD